MNVQVTASHSDLNVRKVFNSRSRSSMLCVAPPNFCILRAKALKHTINDAPMYQRKILPNSSLSSRYQRCPPVCLFGGKGKSENVDEDSQKSIQKGFGNLKKEQSVEDALRQQIEKQEYYDDGDGGGDNGGRDGGGRGGNKGGGRGGYGGSEEGDGFWDELLQVIFATAALVLLYMYITEGEAWAIIARDYIKVLFGAEMTVRVKQNNEWWANLYQGITEVWSRELPSFLRLDLLAWEIAETETWWQKPYLHKFMCYILAKLRKPTKIKRRRRKLKKDEDEGGPEGVDISTIFLDGSNNEDNYETDTDIEVDDKAKSEDELEQEPESEPEPEPSTRLFGDDSDIDSDFDKEFGDVSGSDKECEENSEEEGEDLDPFKSDLIEEDDEKKEDEEKDFRSYQKKTDMAKAEQEEIVDMVAGILERKFIDVFGPQINGPTLVKRDPRKGKKARRGWFK